jgi:hypothetical protein
VKITHLKGKISDRIAGTLKEKIIKY